jgi:hypothetical protein
VYKNHLLAGLACLALLPVAFAAAPPPPALRAPEIKRLIEQLGDRDYRVREQAEKRLHDEGKPALPFLRQALGHRDPEVRRRALRMVPGLENAILFAPKRISLSVRNQPMSKVLDELGKASGYKIQNMSGNMGFPVFAVVGAAVAAAPGAPAAPAAPKERTFSYTFINTPFWDVVDRICRDANLTLQQSWGDDTIRFYQASGFAPHVSRSGAFRLVGNNFQLYRNVDLSTSTSTSRSETLTFSFVVFAEPRLPFMNQGEVRLEAAYDELKNSLLIQRPAGDPNAELWGGRFIGRRYYGGGYKQLSMHVSVQLERRSEKATMMKLLRGVVPMTVLVEQKPIVITEKILAGKDVKKMIGELEFHIQEAKKLPGNQVQVKFSVTNKKSNDYTWQNSLYNRIELHDDKGNKFNIWGTSWGGSGPNNVQMTLTYGNPGVAKPGEPTKFVFMHWETKQHDIEFEFKDVPLP